MRYALLALAIMAFTSCATLPALPDDAGYDLKVTSYHHDDVVVYLYHGSRSRLGRVRAFGGRRTWNLSTSLVRSGVQIMVCVGNHTPINRQCFRTDRTTGGYPGEDGEPGVVLLTVQRGINGVAAVLNG